MCSPGDFCLPNVQNLLEEIGCSKASSPWGEYFQRKRSGGQQVQLDSEEWAGDSSEWIQMLRSCIPTPQVQPLDRMSPVPGQCLFPCQQCCVRELAVLRSTGAQPQATAPSPHPVPSNLVSTWVGDDLNLRQE